MSKRRSKSLLLYQWHRWVGLFAALSALAFSVTGIALNHTDGLGLASRPVDSAWLRRWYHFQPSRLEKAFQADGNWLFAIDGRLYWNHQPLTLDSADALGVVRFDGETVIAFVDRLLLLDDQGKVVEELDESIGLPGKVRRLGQSASGQLALDTGKGQYLSGQSLLDWRADQSDISWDEPDAAAGAALDRALQQSERRKLNLESLLLDLHSGRFFGKVGVWLADLAALALMFLGISGVLIWLVRLSKKHQHRKRQIRAH